MKSGVLHIVGGAYISGFCRGNLKLITLGSERVIEVRVRWGLGIQIEWPLYRTQAAVSFC